MRRRSFLPPLALVTFAVAACGPAAVEVKPPTTVKAGPPKPAVESPARWVLHPSSSSTLRAKLDLGDAGTLYVGDGGERWLDKHDASGATPAATLLPESIAAVAHDADGKGVVFAGVSGTVYAAKEPLGAIASTHAPSVKMRAIAAGKQSVVAIADDGSIVRTTDAGASWNKVDAPPGGGVALEIAMNDQGWGAVLFAPQRVIATTDDGAHWANIATPGVGARKLVLDVNGDLMLEGLEASGVFRPQPPHFERVARAPKSGGFELPSNPEGVQLKFANAIATGHAAILGTRYVEVEKEPDDESRWQIVIAPLGAKAEPKKIPDLNGCEHVIVGGDASTILLACDGQATKGKNNKNPAPAPPEQTASYRIYRSDDDGKSWREDGTVGSERSDAGHVWKAPDGSILLQGACKKYKYGCLAAPLVRAPDAKNFARIGLPKSTLSLDALAFSANANKAFALGQASNGAVVILVSTDGGKDFARVPFPSIPMSDDTKDVSASNYDPGTISVDGSNVYASAHAGDKWLVLTSTDDGASFTARPVPFKADALAMVGKRGFAYEHHGKGWETSDGGATWTAMSAPASNEASAASVACGEYGCFLGDRATRVGWGGDASPTTSGNGAAGAGYATPLKCSVDGAWTSLGPIVSMPSAYEAEEGGGHWIALKQDPTKGSVSVVVGKVGAKGLETKEVSLFGAAGHDVATIGVPQVEGAAALRFSFRRDKPAKGSTLGPIVAGQKVDVELAWYLASTGKVQRATLRGVGPLDPRDIGIAGATVAAQPNIGLLSIAQGGVHVRPFGTKPEAPLYFVHDDGKVDRMSWPELPSKDAAGAALPSRVDALRVGNRSVVVQVSTLGLQLYTAWANEAGTSWESRAWGIWPEMHGMANEVGWDFTYVTDGGAPRPAFVAMWPGGEGVPAQGWAALIEKPDPDPSQVVALPTQRDVADPPKSCDAGSASTVRVVAPYLDGDRHPIVVSGDTTPIVLATASAVMHGNGKDACVDAYEARPAATSIGYAAIVPVGDLAHAYLFHATGGGGQEVSVRTMSCTFEKGALPDALIGAEGFVGAKP